MTEAISVLDPAIAKKCYRKTEAVPKVNFILADTRIPLSIVVKAASVARLNPFHNFDHALDFAVAAIRIGKEEGLAADDLTVLAFAALFHDAHHSGFVTYKDELRSVLAIEQVVTPADVKTFTETGFQPFMTKVRDLILVTAFSLHGKVSSLRERIMQDADLSHLGRGPAYWMWASMGLLREFNSTRSPKTSLTEFVRSEQRGFITHLAHNGYEGSVYLTAGARTIFSDPHEALAVIENLDTAAVEYAYLAYDEDITFDQFKKRIGLE